MNPAAEGAAAQKSRHKKDKEEKKKKRKDATEHHGADASAAEEESVHKKKKQKKQKMDNDEGKAEPKQKPTVSIAVAGSIIDNAQSLELAPPSWPVRLPARQPSSASTRSLSSTAIPRRRTAVVPKVKRRVVRGFLSGYWSIWKRHSTCAAASSRCIRTLSLWGCFRRSMHHTICASTSGVNFVKTGVTLDGDRSKGTLVDVGLSKNVLVEQILERGKRVTIAMGTNRDITTACVRKVVSPSTPSEEMGSYWGYKVRYASNLSGVLNDSPYKEGYDHIIGTSEHGEIISSSELILPSFRHLLIAFGGLAGLEESIEEDINLKGKGANDVFTSYLNTCPNQGSRTIRTEEALLISLQYFQDPIRRAK